MHLLDEAQMSCSGWCQLALDLVYFNSFTNCPGCVFYQPLATCIQNGGAPRHMLQHEFHSI